MCPKPLLRSVCLAWMCVSCLPAQQKLDRGNMHERILCIVPMGRFADLRRPLFAPIANEVAGGSNILSFAYQLALGISDTHGNDGLAVGVLLASPVAGAWAGQRSRRCVL